MAHYKLRKDTERTIIKLVAFMFLIYIVVICFVIFHKENQTSTKLDPNKDHAATLQQTSDTTDLQTRPITYIDFPNLQTIIHTKKYKKPDLMCLQNGLPNFIHPASLSSSPGCQKARSKMASLNIDLYNCEQNTLFTSIKWFSKYWLGYTEWLNNCLGSLQTYDILNRDSEVEVLKDKIIILINRSMFGELVNQLDNLNKFIYIDKNITIENDVELVYKKEIHILTPRIDAPLSCIVEKTPVIKEIYYNSFRKNEIVYDYKGLVQKKPTEALLDTLYYFKSFVYKFPICILLQIYTHLYDIEINDREKLSFDIKARNIFEDEKLNEFLNNLTPYMEVNTKSLLLILEKIKYIKDIEREIDTNSLLIENNKLSEDIIDLFNKTIEKFEEIYEGMEKLNN